ncbi:MAG TPA: hypothetical protein VL689_19390 [Paraburkholderia sp.]|nr:hypothetical protein [Paraburkholderia sp.]
MRGFIATFVAFSSGLARTERFKIIGGAHAQQAAGVAAVEEKENVCTSMRHGAGLPLSWGPRATLAANAHRHCHRRRPVFKG